MKFFNDEEEVFRTASANERPTIAMLIASECEVKDVDGRLFKECTYTNHALKDKKGYGYLIIKVQEA